MNPALVLTGIALIAISVPMILGRIPRNPFYGFRTPRTLRSDAVWYPANQFAGKALACAGVGWTLAALALPTAAAVTVGTVSLVAAIAASFVYLSRL